MCNSHSLRVIYVLCSCIDIFNLVGFVLSLCMLHVVWLSGYKTSNFSRSLHEVEVSTFMYSRVDFVLLCERGFTDRLSCNIGEKVTKFQIPILKGNPDGITIHDRLVFLQWLL